MWRASKPCIAASASARPYIEIGTDIDHAAIRWFDLPTGRRGRANPRSGRSARG